MTDSVKRFAFLLIIYSSSMACASPIGNTARTVIPAQVQQIISIDCVAVRRSSQALGFEAQVLPPKLKEFQSALKTIAINPNTDLENLTFASFRDNRQAIKMIAVATGEFTTEAVLRQLRHQSQPNKYQEALVFPLSDKISVTLVDDNTMLLGDDSALKTALDTHKGALPSLNSNSTLGELMSSVEAASVWSVLDQRGSQNMVLSAMGAPDNFPEYQKIKDAILGCDYAMNFENGIKFDLAMTTSNAAVPPDLAALLRAGVLYKKVAQAPAQNVAMHSMKVKIDKSSMQMHFEADRQAFEDLLRSEFFAAVTR